jgi:UbiD family decarboxylase
VAYDDLRSFLDTLDRGGQLLRISDELDPEPDLAAAANAACRLGDTAPALYFDNVRGFTNARIAMNVHGSWANHALALGMDKTSSTRDQVDEFIRRWAKFPVKPCYRDDPPWAQNTQDGDDINVFEVLPLFRLNDGDGGFYIDKAAVVSKDPDDPTSTDKQNVGVYRIEVKGRRKLALQPVPMHDIAQHLRKAEQRGHDLPIAITLGNDPVISIVASTPMEYDQNEYELAGALRGEPAPIARSPLYELPVPWGSEVVIEGVIEGRKREIEGPFGEFTGHYSGGRRMTVIRVDKISYRDDLIFEHLYLGMPWTEIDYLLAANTCVPLYEQLKRDYPEVQAVNAMYTHGLVVIVSTQKRFGGFAKEVGMRVLTTPHGLGYAATVIVVDEDVDPFNLPQVMWALSTKMNPAGDLIRVPNLSILELAPQAETPGIVDKLIIDATTPVPPDNRGNYGNQVHDLPEAREWLTRLQQLTATRRPQ